MRELSIFVDEAGQQDMSDGYYLLTLVVHDQSVPIVEHVEEYERQLRAGGLPDIPFHMVCLLHGHGDYDGLNPHVRKALLSRFNAFVRHLPIEYHTFSYSSYDVGGVKELSARMRRDLVNFVYEHLEGFQSFDRVVIYYDDGQQAVTKALHEAFDFMLGDGAVEYRRLRYQDRRLSQVADYLSSVELAAMRYAEGLESSTYLKFYGLRGDLRRNYLKQARRKLI